MRADRFRLKREQQRLSPERYAERLQQSVRQREIREAASPRIEYSEDLPITAHRDELIELIRSRQVIVVCGETGSGKSTQLPKLCLEAGLGREAMIGHTQPRRLAARSIGTRLAEELGTTVGKEVGFQVRFGDQTGPETLIKLMTDGILLAETQSDRFLDTYDAIIIDEAHERSLNIDFLLGYLRRLQGKRPDLKIIITSATIDAERFAEHFSDEDGPAPIVNVEGRGFPVELRYLPWDEVVDDDSRGYDLARHVIEGIDATSRGSYGAGDTLVFLPTERDIREVSHRVSAHFQRLGMTNRVDLLPLYARLPQSQQQEIFQPSGKKRRIIFSTNVAESSLTVPGIHSVVDSGTARISRYSARSKVQRLPIEDVSRASANQRSGRCGRIAPGTCVRLYAESDFQSRDEFTTPEIRRTNLASVVLQTKTLGLGPLSEFPLLDPPRPEAVREGVRTLTELGALDERQELTDIGWTLGRMPVDPRVGRIIMAAEEYGVLAEVLPIAAALEIQDPRDRPPEKRQAADEAHSQFADPESDFLSYLKLWRFYEYARGEYGRGKLTRIMRQNFLSPNRMREWSDVYRQLREMASSTLRSQPTKHKSEPGDGSGRKPKASKGRGPTRSQGRGNRVKIGKIRYSDDESEVVDGDRYESIHKALLTGFLSGVGHAGDKNEYTGAGGLKLFLWPGSGVFGAKPKWIVAAELVETAKQYARTVARIQPQWIEHVGGHVLKISHSDPHWSAKSGGAFCSQRQSLFGLPVVVGRRVPLSPVDPATARDLLIEHGLVNCQLKTNARFLRHNQSLVESITQLAAKTRRRDLVIDDYSLELFYQARIPETVCDRGRLEKFDRNLEAPAWTKTLRSAEDVARWLHTPPPIDDADTTAPPPYMRVDDLIRNDADEIGGEAYPDVLQVGQSKLPLEYRFEPGAERDGISVKVHQAALAQVSDERLGWLVPGMLHGKLLAMIKSLPKRIRRNLVPAADIASKIEDELRECYGQVPFMPAVCQAMSRHAEMPVGEADFQAEKMADHLQFLIQVVDDDGATIAEGRDVAPLQQTLATRPDSAPTASVPSAAADWMRESMKSFDVDALPAEFVSQRGGVQVAQYPGLVDQGADVATRLFSDQRTAEESTRKGLMRLFAITQLKELRNQARWIPAMEDAKIRFGGLVSAGAIESAIIDLLARIAFVEGEPVIRSRAEFDRRSDDRGQRIAKATQDVAGWLQQFSQNYFLLRREFEETKGGQFATTIGDVRAQMKWLYADGFLSSTPWAWLKHYPRYTAAITYRLDKRRSGSAPRDDEGRILVDGLWSRWLSTLPESSRTPEANTESEFRWMIEELRVSLFAQPLGTAHKVSPKRCEKLLGR